MAGLYNGGLPRTKTPMFLVVELLNVCAMAQLALNHPQDDQIVNILEKALADLNINDLAEHIYHLSKTSDYDLEKTSRWPNIYLDYTGGGIQMEHISIEIKVKHETDADISEELESPKKIF